MIAYCGSMKQFRNVKMCFKLLELNDFFGKIEILESTLYNSWWNKKQRLWLFEFLIIMQGCKKCI